MKKWLLIIGVLVLVIAAGCGGPVLDVSETSLDFGAAKTHLTFKLVNSGSGSMNWSITDDRSWLSVKPFGGRTGRDTIQVIVEVDRSNLTPNKYTGTVKITSDGGDTALAVTMIRLDNPIVELETTLGNIKLELFPDVAPNHVRNFLDLAKSGFYDGLIFHRVIDGFMIQAGAFDAEGNFKETDIILNDEISDSLHYEGTLAMARRQERNSASTQFYICLVPKPNLDGKYTVFGKTIEGLDVVHTIGKVKTSGPKGRPPDWPVKPVYINKINIIKDFVPIE
jgi:peptidyl-prolyl cis-trans isomerase A (cyclophilin A)